jgi:tetratricopeptide (TPR) repeat protein
MVQRKHLSAIACGISMTVAVLSLSPAFAAAKTTTSKATSGKGRRAEGNFREKIFHGTVSAMAATGEQQLLDGKYDDAAASFRKALAKNPKDQAALSGLGFALTLNYKLDGADQQFDKALKLDPTDPLAHVGKAQIKLFSLQSSNMTLIKQKNDILRNAENECQQALSKDPGMPEAYVTLGMIKREQGQLNDAIANYSKAIETDPKFVVAYTRRGLAELDQGNNAAAQQDFKQSLSMRAANNSAAHYGLGRVYTNLGQYDAAYNELNTALAQNTNSAPVRIARGDLYAKQGNIVGALKEYNGAVAIKAENSDAYLKIADIYEDRGDLEMSLADLRSGLMLNPDSQPLHERIADINLRLEKFDNAIKEYNTALDLQPGDAKAVKGLTRAYMLKSQKDASGAFFMSNNFEEAEAQIQKAIRLNPNDLELRLADAKFRAMSGQQIDLSQIGTPTNDAERVAYAEALLAQFRYNEAGQQMQMVIGHQNDPKQLCALADMSLLIHDLQSAYAAYSRAGQLAQTADGAARARRGLQQVGKAQSDAQKSLNLGADLSKRKQLASGIDNYRNAAYLNPRLADAHLGLAEALRKYYEKDPPHLREAAAQYRAFLSLVPNLPEKEREKYQKAAEKCEERAFNIERKGQPGN